MAAPCGSGEAREAPERPSMFLLGDHLDADPHVGVDLEQKDLGWLDPEVADVERLLPFDDERALVGGGDRHLPLDLPGHAVEREVAPNAVAATVLLELSGLTPDRGVTPGIDAAHHFGVFELLPRLQLVDGQLDLDPGHPRDVDAAVGHLGLDGALEPVRLTVDRVHARTRLDPHSRAVGIDPERCHHYMSRSLR